ncbi:DUF2218 domain-containing protein [Methylobacterium organophilum]|uniref:DUF2218 domain-containing protein n=1 Tax=Methylobacterium organophilum TaxID=410 RepID=A0ABQ4T687_METOR|nr:DUF2218 domain-containing protein [Methylobacterium organophilum]UMY17711.1 DUF2218 domain-containing protein [Methylobacterium organophilum]GJE26059.1 hypothetical protein LKMONMHP_0903 [Methylobacterium organophilum]
MPTSQARVPTSEANRYLKQLCRHWSHKFPVEETGDHGVVPFGEDRICTFDASPDALVMKVATPDAAGLTRLENVVADHLLRFAFREHLGEIIWSRAA